MSINQDVLADIPEKQREALKNVTLKEATGLAFDLGLEILEKRAKELWPGVHTVLVSKDEIKGSSQVSEYEGYGYTVLEDGAKSVWTVPNRSMVRMGISAELWDAQEDERVKRQNSTVGHTPGTAPLGQPFQQIGAPTSLDNILKSADQNTANATFQDPTIDLGGGDSETE